MPKSTNGSQGAVARELPPLPMPPLPMPPLPANPPRPWAGKANPSAATVQQAYLARREEEMLAQAPVFQRLAYNVIREYLSGLPGWKPFGVSAKEVKAAYDHINRSMQSADLTINIEAHSWFSRENPYDSYAQMYERCTDANGVMVLKNDNINEAVVRANVDNQISIPSDWSNAVDGPRRGLAPNVQSGARIRAQMHTGTMVPVNPADTSLGYHASNARFNPRTKQVFAALNYARRQHGGATGYGFSHFILNPELKTQAIFYPLDSFHSHRVGTAGQASYSHLASILSALGGNSPLVREGKAGALQQEIFDMCYHGKKTRELEGSGRLIEAHLFSEIRFRDHVVALVVSPKTDRDDLAQVPFSTVVANAKKFANKHGIKLYQAP